MNKEFVFHEKDTTHLSHSQKEQLEKTFTQVILSKDLVKCTVIENKKAIYIMGLDTTGILAHIVGIISLQGLIIEKASSYFHGHEGRVYFVDVFYIDSEHIQKENWEDDLPELIEQQTKLVYEKKHFESQKKIINNFVEFIAQEKANTQKDPVLNIEIKNYDEHLKILVQGEDMPFLLYMISLGIEHQRLSIINFEVNTQQCFVEDIFYVSKPKNLDEESVNRLRLNLILNIQFGFLLYKSPNPYQAFIHFQEMISSLEKEDISNILEFLISQDKQKEGLATLLGSGDYLWEDFVRTHSQEVVKMLINTSQEAGIENEFFEQELSELLSQEDDYEKKVDILNTYKDEKIFAIDINSIMKKNQDIQAFGLELSELAKTIVRQATEIIEEKLISMYGRPQSTVGHRSDWALFALGKFGGSALGYASDIELMFIYEDSGSTNGAEKISNREYFDLFIKEITRIIRASREGIFKIDLRLRPFGEAGPLAVRLHSFIDYYISENAHSIELLSLTRMRPIAGNSGLVERVLKINKSILYQPNSIDMEQIFEMREKQMQEKVAPQTRNAKFGHGTLVDLEYGVQMLQLQYGKNHLGLQQPSIHSALETICEIGEISKPDSEFLIKAYFFFRQLINALRIRRGNAKDLTLPKEESWELEHLARRMGYMSDPDLSAGAKLLFNFDSYSVGVDNFIKKFFKKASANLSNTITNPAQIVYLENINDDKSILKYFQNPNLALQSIKKCYKDESTQLLFSQILLLMWLRIIRRGDSDLVMVTFARVVEKLSIEATKELYNNLLAQPKSLGVLVDIFVTSRFLSEEIIKNPQYIFDFLKLKNVRQEKFLDEYKKDLDNMFLEKEPKNVLAEKNLLREFRKKETLRIIIRDVCIRAPLQHICSEISCLAEVLIQKSLEICCKKRQLSSQGIVILAFGKLGSHELNYSSDLDLLCVYDNSCVLALQEIIEIFLETVKNLTDYTSSGMAYRVDLRLRPFGDGGDVVTSLVAFQNYYQTQAQLWEIQASLKLSFVGGDEALGNTCLSELTEINKKRLEQFSRQDIITQIHQLRTKSVHTHIKESEKELFEIKNSWGGIRDIEFSVQALLLIYYNHNFHYAKLSTIEAIKILTKEQIIPHTTQTSIIKHYLFLRRVEHFLQVYEDKQLHAIPQNDNIVKKRLAWLLMQEQDEDMFINKLEKTKEEVHNWYESIFLEIGDA